MRQLKLLPGTMILMLASILSINPVSAQPTPESSTGGTQNQIDPNTPQTPTRTNTQPAPTPMQVEGQSAPTSTPTQTEGQSVPSSTDTNAANTVTGTVRSIEGQVVTLATADGVTRQMRVSSADLQRLNLREGMQISATVDAQSVASNITVAQSSTTQTGSEATGSQADPTSTQTGTEAIGSQTGTTTTTESTTSTPSTETDASSETPTTTTESTTSETDSTNRPVRALW